MNNYLDQLNSSQRLAVEATEGPVMIIAGAGSGKTRVLTYRIAHLINKGIYAHNILSLTFTNKASYEMQDRISKIVGSVKSQDIWMGTFHSVFSKVLRIESTRLGYSSNFIIHDAYDSKNIVKEIIKQFNLDDQLYKASAVLKRISFAKNKLISAQQYLNDPDFLKEDTASQTPLIGQLYLAYQKYIFKLDAMDFDDLLYNTTVLFRDFPEVLLKYQDKFKYILVDEYQDTNYAQYVIIKQLGERFQNICVVGDDAQSIYAFRGADIDNILNFQEDYNDVQIFSLDHNYRSTKNIVQVSNIIISNNKHQFKKSVFTDNFEGDKIKLIRTNTDREEAEVVVNSISETKTEKQALNKDFAILYRTNAQSRYFEEALLKLNIPYKIYGGISFYNRKEIKDVLSYYNLIINNNNDECLKRVINYPTRGIGQTTINKLCSCASDNNITIWTVIDNLKYFNNSLGINKATFNKINDFVLMIKSFSLQLYSKNAFDLGYSILSTVGIINELYQDKTPDGINRYENVESLVKRMKDFCDNDRSYLDNQLNNEVKDGIDSENNFRRLDEFMHDIALLTNTDEEDKNDSALDKVALMTVHSSKGLEFNYVYVVGMEDNLFPSPMSLDSIKDIEEERRLFYVAVTRSCKNVTLTYANNRFKFGNSSFCEPSRFLGEIDERYLDIVKSAKTQTILKSSFSLIDEDLEDMDLSTLKDGDNVLHKKFGKGTVISIKGVWPDSNATINFDSSGQKNLLLKFCKLSLA